MIEDNKRYFTLQSRHDNQDNGIVSFTLAAIGEDVAIADRSVGPVKIDPTGSTAGQVMISTGADSDVGWGTLTAITSVTTPAASGLELTGCDTGECGISLNVDGMDSLALDRLSSPDTVIVAEGTAERKSTLGDLATFTYERIIHLTDLADLADGDHFVVNDASAGSDQPRDINAGNVSNYIGTRLAGDNLTYNTTTNQLDTIAGQIELIDSLNDVDYTQADTANLSTRFGGETVYTADLDAEGTDDAEINDILVFQWRDNPAGLPADRQLGIRINDTGTTLPIRVVNPVTRSLANKRVADLTRYEFLFLSRQDGVFIQLSGLELASLIARLLPTATDDQIARYDASTSAWVAEDLPSPTAAGVTVTASGFDGSLTTNATNVQLALQEIDDLTITGTDDQTAAEVPLDTTSFNRLLDATDDTTVQNLADAFDDLPGGIVQYSNAVTYIVAVQQLTATVEIFTVNGDLLVLEMPSTLDDSTDDLMLRTQVGVTTSATRTVTDVDGNAISPSDLVAERTYTFVHIGNNFQLIDPLPAAAGGGIMLQKFVNSSSASSTLADGVWTTLISQSITVSGATDRVFVDAIVPFEFLTNADATCSVRVARGTTQVGDASQGASYVVQEIHPTEVRVMDDSPGAGTYTYNVQVQDSHGDGTCSVNPQGTSSFATFEVLSANP